MSGKASADFGLFKEKFEDNQIKSLKFILIVIGLILLFLFIIYLFVYLSKSIFFKNNNNSNNDDEIDYAEKLIGFQQSTNLLKLPPKPFGVTYHGNRPTEFLPSTTTTTTEKITTLNYPQLNHYRHRYYPNNIQDIINYISRFNQTTNDEKNVHILTPPPPPPPPPLQLPPIINDPFYRYKPKDPSDINLLAPNNLRFAPPIWRNMKRTTTTTTTTMLPPLLFPPRFLHQQENSNNKEVYRFSNNDLNNRQPLFITVNVYQNDLKQQQQKYNNNYYKTDNNDMKVKLFEPNKMVIFLNLYPDRHNKIRKL